MLRYKEKELIKIDATLGGKNPLKGFYKDQEGLVYFVKKPNDIKELFTELLAGLLLKEFKQRKLIAPQYFDSLINADWIRFEDGSYGLIQPKVEFTELFKVIGTGFSDNSDRNPLIEILNGSNSYALLTSEFKSYYGLSIALMFSMLFGDYSVHSGNVVCFKHSLLPNNNKVTQFARIDWGAAFRYFNYYDDILNPFEYQGWSKFKLYTKGYIFNYKKINGLFPAIAKKAFDLRTKVDDRLLYEIVLSALKEIPPDLLPFSAQNALAEYLGFSSFNTVIFNEYKNYQPFVKDFPATLFKRLNHLSALRNLTKDRAFLYQSMCFDNLTDIKGGFTSESSDEGNLLACQNGLSYEKLTDEKYIIKLVNRFNDELLTDPIFMSILAEGKMVNFIPEIINDLLILKKFYTTKIESNNEKKHDHILSNYLVDFYKESILIRLSDKDSFTQANALLELAYKYLFENDKRLSFLEEVFHMLDGLFNGNILISKIHNKAKDKTRFFNYKDKKFSPELSESSDLLLYK